MCVQCAMGAMTAVAGASGARLWLETRAPWLARPRVRTAARRGIVVAGVLAAGVLGPSPHGAAPGAATPAKAAPAPAPAVAAAPVADASR
ncbi:hypothetical protein [Patulibacter sp. SYSU D01012]|uniref:hypothetical protein n=1 Tax=Patulibacter sp. SYSU D01012 TaxID=2817381 RepID=UPI001B308738|nr:hypothetical protein [Patulibacter sp. SYSU D01012]